MAAQITYDDVAGAALQLKNENRPIGPTKVREMLGRGSFTTVQKYLSEWESEQTKLKDQAAEERRIGPPEELFSELEKIMSAYWPQAVARAKEQMKPETDALHAQLTECGTRHREALLEIGNLENRLEAALVKAARQEEAEKRSSEANEKIISLQAQLSHLEKIEARFDSQKEVIQNLEKQVLSIAGVLDHNKALTEKIEAVNSALSEARIKMAKLEARLEVPAKK